MAQVALRRAKVGGSSNQWQKEVQEEKARAEYWERKFQEMQVQNLALEEEDKGLKTKVIELGKSLRWHQNHNSTVELKELRSKVEDLELALYDGELRVEQLKAQEDYLRGELHQAKEQVEKRGRKENLEITHPYGTCAKTKNMDQRFEQLQKDMQDQMQEQLAKIQNEMREQMLEAQRNMMAEMAQLLRATDKGKTPMAITKEENEGPPLGFTPPHVPPQTEVPPRRPSVTVRPQYGPVNAGIPINFPSGLGNNLGDSSILLLLIWI
ncbi:uncharacterized protein [Gossypium hirsutum]|uniref:Uncharacterized protein n=1 Tax=Gossypium hirsutum TaxID=3635 RepID=A0ABM2Z8W2_GOSHI|nr:uncharacterized protein LOC121211027 [Gossypium hirsutum]